MRVAIGGAGIAGAYAYRLLGEQGIKADLFDIEKRNRCKLRPCAWGAAPSSEYERLVSKFLEPKDYVLEHFETIAVNGRTVRANMDTIDKPRLVRDLIGDARVTNDPLPSESYDRVIDATGVNRAFLPPTEGPELLVECFQRRVRSEKKMPLSFSSMKFGYEWCFPIGGNEYHLGYGSLEAPAKGSRPFPKDGDCITTICSCSSNIRLTSPHFSTPFVSEGKFVGVGESIGAVGPLAGDGNIYAMQCGEMLLELWDDLDEYQAKVLKRYDWMRKERRVLEKLWAGKKPSITDMGTFIKHSKTVGVEISAAQALDLFLHAFERPPSNP
jgi:flavin-dependent dehydrogenase